MSMSYEKYEIESYKKAKAELCFYKYIFAATTLSLFIGGIFFREQMPVIIGSMVAILMGVTIKSFLYDPVSKVTNLVDRSINSSVENISKG